VLLAGLLLISLPIWLIVGVALSPLVTGHLRVPRLIWLAIVYLVWDAAALIALAVLWVAAGFGWKIRTPAFQRAHYVLTGKFLAVLFWIARWSLHLAVDVVGTDPDTAEPGRPEIVVSRHAGPGAAHRAEVEPAVGSGRRRAAQSAAQPLHLARPQRRPDPHGRRAGRRARRQRRLRDLSGGWQLHPAPSDAGDRVAQGPRYERPGRTRGEAAQRAAAETGRAVRRAGRRPGLRGRLRRAYRAGPDGDDR
jgi:hypothetical protein